MKHKFISKPLWVGFKLRMQPVSTRENERTYEVLDESGRTVIGESPEVIADVVRHLPELARKLEKMLKSAKDSSVKDQAACMLELLGYSLHKPKAHPLLDVPVKVVFYRTRTDKAGNRMGYCEFTNPANEKSCVVCLGWGYHLDTCERAEWHIRNAWPEEADTRWDLVEMRTTEKNVEKMMRTHPDMPASNPKAVLDYITERLL